MCAKFRPDWNLHTRAIVIFAKCMKWWRKKNKKTRKAKKFLQKFADSYLRKDLRNLSQIWNMVFPLQKLTPLYIWYHLDNVSQSYRYVFTVPVNILTLFARTPLSWATWRMHNIYCVLIVIKMQYSYSDKRCHYSISGLLTSMCLWGYYHWSCTNCYLEVLESSVFHHSDMKEKLSNEYRHTVCKMLHSSLTGKSIIRATNSCAITKIIYSAGIVNCTQQELHQLDRKICKLPSLHGVFYCSSDVYRSYLYIYIYFLPLGW